MVIIYWWQLILAISVLFVGMYWIVESRVKRNNDIIAEYLSLKNRNIKHLVLGMASSLEKDIKEIEDRLGQVEDDRDIIKEDN